MAEAEVNLVFLFLVCAMLHVVVEWLTAQNSSCGVSDQQSLGSSPDLGICVLK